MVEFPSLSMNISDLMAQIYFISKSHNYSKIVIYVMLKMRRD